MNNYEVLWVSECFLSSIILYWITLKSTDDDRLYDTIDIIIYIYTLRNAIYDDTELPKLITCTDYSPSSNSYISINVWHIL